MRFFKDNDAHWETFKRHLVGKFYDNCMVPVKETIEKNLDIYTDCYRSSTRELARLHHTRKVARLEAEKKNLTVRVGQLKMAFRKVAPIDAKKAPRPENPDDFTDAEAKDWAYFAIERLMPNRIAPKFSMDHWEDRLYRNLYQYLSISVVQEEKLRQAPHWLLPIMAKIDGVT